MRNLRRHRSRIILIMAQADYERSAAISVKLNSQASTECLEPPIEKKPKLNNEGDDVKVQMATKFPGISGLHNIGNTCYFNSTLQCILNTPGMNDKFLTDQIKPEINPKHKQVALQYWQLLKRIRQMVNNQNTSHNPSSLKQAISNATQKFRGHRQEDSQEFLRAFLTCLHEDLNRVTKNPPYRELTADLSKQCLQEIATQWFNYFKSRDNSIVSDYFTGQLLNRVICTVCQHESIAFDNFQDLSLAFPKQGPNRLSIEEMLQFYLNDEELNNSYRCAKCKQQRRCIRKFEIWRVPDIVVLHLKRFCQNGFKRSKITTPVKYGAQLDLSPFVKSGHESSQYELYGVVKHYGDLNFGHYYAECKNPYSGRWNVFNDSSVGRMDNLISDVDDSAYLLFYSRRK